MGTYTQTRILLPSGLDEVGLTLGLQRIEGESVANYRQRLLLEARDRSGPTQEQIIRGMARKVGEFDVPVFKITLILDANDIPLAADPYIEVTSTVIRAYSDYASGTLDFEHYLNDRTDGYFLKVIKASFDASTFFDLEVLDTSYEYKKSSHLRFGNTNGYVSREFLRTSKSNKLLEDNIKDIYPDIGVIFRNEVASTALVLEEGDYYIDYVNGVIITYNTAAGFIGYTYRDFPYTLHWQPVRMWPFNDSDKVYLINDTTLDDLGAEVNNKLNSQGAEIVNEILSVHPLSWGE